MGDYSGEVKPLISKELLDVLFEIIESISATFPHEVEKTLEFLARRVAEVMNAFSCNLRLFDPETGQLVLKGSYGLSGAYKEKPAVAVGESIAGLVFKQNRVLSVKDIKQEPRYVYRRYAEREGARALLCAPLSVEGRPIGTLSIYFQNVREFSDEEEKFFAILSNYLSAMVEILRLQADLHRHYMETIRALVVALEAKDKYTYGHSERVAEYAAAIAEEMGLPAHQVRLYHDAGILHDIGKLTLDLTLLDKPGRLMEDEYEVLKEHPVVGERIIRPLKMFGAFLRPVRHHHERVNGLGYPNGLKSDELDLLICTMAVADAYDAMVSRRPYREPMSQEDAMRELWMGSGLQFEPRVVEAFIRVLKKGFLLGSER